MQTPSAMHSRPLLPPAIALAVGVWCAARWPVDGLYAGALAAITLLLARWTGWPAAGLAGWVLLGATAMALASPPPEGEHPLDAMCGGQVVAMRGTTRSPPRVRSDGSWEVPVVVDHPAPGTVLLGASGGPPPPPGARVAVRASLFHAGQTHTPGQRDRRTADRRAGEAWHVRGRPGSALVSARGEPTPVVRLRRAVRRFLTSRLEPPVDGLALALVLGDRSRLDPELRDRFARTGTAHLLALSGLHVGVVALVAGVLARSLVVRWPRLRRRLAPRVAGIVVGVLAAAAYGTLTGWALSTRRAAAMAAVLGLVLLLRRRVDPLQVIAVAWIGLLLCDPACLFEPATALSFGSVVALIRLTPELGRRPWRSAVVGSAAVAVGTAPLSLACFGQVPLLSVPVNVVAIPVLGGVLVPTLLVASATGLLWPAGGSALLALADAVARAGLAVIEGVGDPRWSPMLRASPAPGVVVLSLAGMAAALALPRLRNRWLAAVAAAAVALLPVHPAAPPRGELALTVFDVGHGDAMLLSLPTGERILIDAGAGPDDFDAGDRIVVPALRRMGVRHLDGAVITHLHADHFGGMAAVLAAIPTDVLWLPLIPPRDHPARAVFAAASRHGTTIRAIDHGQAPPRRIGDVSIETLHPAPGRPCPRGEPRCGPNDHSVVLRVTHSGRSFLLTGDAEAGLEAALIDDGRALGADVLKVPHHGSDTSCSSAFTAAVDPLLAVVSADPDERRHFPRPSVRRRLAEAGATVLVTGSDGTTQISTDGVTLRSRTFRVDRGWDRWRVDPMAPR